MTNVLLIAVAPPVERTVLIDALRRFRETGATVRLACFFDVQTLAVDPELAELHSFAARPGDDARFRRKVNRAQPARRPWLHARRSAWIRRHARQADLLVALDPRAVNTVWELAQRNSQADAISGLAPALRALTARLAATDTRGAPAPAAIGSLGRQLRLTTLIGVRGTRRFVVDAGRNTLMTASGARVMRLPAGAWLWRQALTAPRIPDQVRGKLALRVHTSMVRAGRPSVAASTSAAVASRMRSAEARAGLLADEALAEFALGRVPTDLRAAVAAQLGYADARIGKDPQQAVEALARAWELLTHRVLHHDRLQSPLVAEPATFLAPVRASAVARRLSAPRGRATGPESPPSGRPLRLLLAVPQLDGEADGLRRLCEELPGVELRILEINAGPDGPMTRNTKPVMEEILTATSPFGARVEDWLRPHLNWADTVLVDHCLSAAALFTLHDPGTARIIVRLNGPEIFELWPHLVDFSRVDTLVLPSAHLREPVQAVFPQLAGAGAPRIEVIGSPLDLRSFDRPKPPEARFTVGLVGFNAVTKDPRWAIDVLRELRKRDDRYRLLMLGRDLSGKSSAAAKQYAVLLRRDYAEFEASGAIQRPGATDDPPQALTEIGVILDSSVYTGFPTVLVEAAASGAVPIARDWPAFAGKPDGARTLLPADWVAATPEDAAERVLAATATEERWRKAGREAAAHAYLSWDWPIVRERFRQLLESGPDLTLGRD